MQADEAYCIGPAASSESYLRGDKIVQLAKSVGAQVLLLYYTLLFTSYTVHMDSSILERQREIALNL